MDDIHLECISNRYIEHRLITLTEGIEETTGKNKESEAYTIRLNKEYVGEWLPIKDEMHYLLIEV